jgi:hypothetical protein
MGNAHVREPCAGCDARCVPDENWLEFENETWRLKSIQCFLPARFQPHVGQTALGVRLTATVLRATGATLDADASNHTVCLFLGWSPRRALDFAYGRREVIADLELDMAENGNCESKAKQNKPHRPTQRGFGAKVPLRAVPRDAHRSV